MFIQQTNLPLQTIKLYLRLKDKKSFILYLKEPIILSQLKQLIIKKTKIPQHDLVVMYQGKIINFSHQSQSVSFKDNSILHIINKKFVRNDIIQISVKFILRNDQKACLGETNLFTKSQQSINDFINSKVIRVIQDRTEQKIYQQDLNLVLNGMVLKKNINFQNYLIEDGSEIICMISNSQVLQKFANNVSTHKILVSYRQKFHDQEKILTKSQYDPKSSPLQLSPQKKKSQIEKKPSLTLSQNLSQEFIKLKTFESKQQLAEKERLFNEAFQNENDGKKLKKKLKITSDLTQKFQHQHQDQHEKQHENERFQKIEKNNEENQLEQAPLTQLQSSPQLEPQQNKSSKFIKSENQQGQSQHNGFKRPTVDVSNLQNKNQANIWNEDPDSPVEVQYPKIERRGPSLVEWDPTTVSESIEERSDRFAIFQNAPQTQNHHTGPVFESKSLPQQTKDALQIPKSQVVSKNDFLIYGSLNDGEQMNTKDYINEVSQKFAELVREKYEQSDNSAIEVEYPKLQKRGEPKAGDFLISDSLNKKSDTFINEELVNRFRDVINKINIKRIEDYDLGEKPEKIQESNQKDITTEVTPQTTQ